METTNLIIRDREPKDIQQEVIYLGIHPELQELDPPVGECSNLVFYSVFIRKPELHIGVCCMYNFTPTEVEIGVRIFIPEYWNKGYGGEVINALCKYAFTAFSPIDTVVVKTPVTNTRAIRCYEKCGFVESGRKAVNGYDMVYMKLSKEVWSEP